MAKQLKLKKSGQGQSIMDTIQSAFAASSILIAFIVSVILYRYVMGSPINFEGGNTHGSPLPGNTLGIIYKGGWVVPVLMTGVLTVLIFIIERMIMLRKARGVHRINVFVKNIQGHLNENKIEEAITLCDKQKGSLANIVRSGLVKYRLLQQESGVDKEQKILILQKELDEATALELPILSKNLVIFSTLSSISVLLGLFGTVLGMIRAFKALAQAGAPDALALATGISEALINTAFGILGSTLAIIFFNYFSNRIDSITFKIDEANFSVVQTFAATTK